MSANHSREAFSRYCEASHQPCAQPYQCGHVCAVEAGKLAQWQGGVRVDGGIATAYQKVPSRISWRLLFFFVVALCFAATAYQIYGG